MAVISDEQVAPGGGADPGAADAPRIAPGDGDKEPEPRSAREVGRQAAARPDDVGTRRERSRSQTRGGRLAWWLIPATLLGAVCVGLFVASIPDAGFIAWMGIVLEVVLFAAIVAMGLTMPIGRSRSLLFAGILGAMAVVGVGVMITIYALATSG